MRKSFDDLIAAEAGLLAFRKAVPGRMTKFRIAELSGVNRPAQGGARAVFMKADAAGGDPASAEQYEARRTAVEKAFSVAATARAEAKGVSFAKAYDELLRAEPVLARIVLD